MTKRRESNSESVIIEKRYGCYRAGVVLSLVLIIILIVVIAIPSVLPGLFDSQEPNTYLLLVLIFLFVILGNAIVFFIHYQHRQARKQRRQSEYGIYTLQRARLRRGESTARSSDIELQKLNHHETDLNSNQKDVPIKK